MHSTIAASSASNTHGTEPQHSKTCLDCGREVPDRFCGHCGQDAHHTHRFTMRYLLLHDLPHSVWHVDRGILYTLRHMLTRPGYAIADYLAGRRARHFRPVTYLLLIGGLGALLMSGLDIEPIPPSRAAEMPKVMVLAMDKYMTVVYKYPSFLYTVLLPLNALVALLLLRATRYNYAEMLISQAFISGTLTLPAFVIIVPIMLYVRDSPHLQNLSMLGMLPSLIYPVWVYMQMLAKTPLTLSQRWIRALSTSVLQLLILMLTAVGLIVVIMLMLIRQDPSLLKDLKPKTAQKPTTTQVLPVRHRCC